MEQELIHDFEEEMNPLPVCGGNLETPVTDQANYYQELRYVIGTQQYLENAD